MERVLLSPDIGDLVFILLRKKKKIQKLNTRPKIYSSSLSQKKKDINIDIRRCMKSEAFVNQKIYQTSKIQKTHHPGHPTKHR